MDAELDDTRWLDVQALSQRMLRPGEELLAVRYFNAPAWKKPKRDRQATYLKALEAHCPVLSVHLGTFMSYGEHCPRCNLQTTRHEEKRSDTAMGAHMVNDLYRKAHEVAYLITGDSDILGATDIARSVRDIEIRVAFPPKRGSNILEKASDEFRFIKAKHLRPCQLPNPVTDNEGNQLAKPATW